MTIFHVVEGLKAHHHNYTLPPTRLQHLMPLLRPCIFKPPQAANNTLLSETVKTTFITINNVAATQNGVACRVGLDYKHATSFFEPIGDLDNSGLREDTGSELTLLPLYFY